MNHNMKAESHFIVSDGNHDVLFNGDCIVCGAAREYHQWIYCPSGKMTDETLWSRLAPGLTRSIQCVPLPDCDIT